MGISSDLHLGEPVTSEIDLIRSEIPIPALVYGTADRDVYKGAFPAR